MRYHKMEVFLLLMRLPPTTSPYTWIKFWNFPNQTILAPVTKCIVILGMKVCSKVKTLMGGYKFFFIHSVYKLYFQNCPKAKLIHCILELIKTVVISSNALRQIQFGPIQWSTIKIVIFFNIRQTLSSK